MSELNGILEDIAGEIGWSATNRLVAIWGGRTLYVPATAAPDHRLAKVLGQRPFERLVAVWGDQTVSLPRNAEFEELRRVRLVSGLLSRGFPEREVARMLLMSPRHVKNLRAQAEAFQLLPLIWRARPPAAADGAAQQGPAGASGAPQACLAYGDEEPRSRGSGRSSE